MNPSINPFANRHNIPHGAGTSANTPRHSQAVPINRALVFHRPRWFNSAMNRIPKNLLSMYPNPWLMISRVWYFIPAKARLLNVATVKGFRYAYTDVYARNATRASVTDVLICFFVYVGDPVSNKEYNIEPACRQAGIKY